MTRWIVAALALWAGVARAQEPEPMPSHIACSPGSVYDWGSGRCLEIAQSTGVIDWKAVTTQPTTTVTFSGPKGPIVLDMKTLGVDLGKNTPPEAARAFWDALAMMQGETQLDRIEKMLRALCAGKPECGR